MEHERNKVLAAIGYLPFLCFIPIYTAREDEFAQFHGKQSLILLITYIVVSLGLWLINLILGGIFGHVPLIGFVFRAIGWVAHNLVGTILAIIYVIIIIIGIIFALAENKWEIPIISAYAKNLRI